MKRILWLLIAVCMLMSLAACGNDAGSMRLAVDGKLTLATNAAFPPYEFYENEQPTGIDIEIGQKIAEKLGLVLAVEDMEFNSIITAVSSGKADVGLAGMTVREDRLEFVNFSDPYTTARQVIIVQEGSDITGPDDLEGKLIGVQEATTGDFYCTEDYGDDAVDRYNKGAEAVLALTQGKVDAVVIDNEPAKVFVSQNAGLKILEAEYALEDYAIAIAKDNTDLLEAVNKALSEMKSDGSLKAIIDKYITAG